MIKYLIIVILLPCVFYAQSKNFKAFSEQYVAKENSYMTGNDWKTFFSSGNAKETLDIEDVDQELLSASVFFMFNKMRAKKRRKPFTFTKELYQSVNTYGNYYRSGSFKKRDGNIRKANKCVRYVSKKQEYYGAFQRVYIKQSQAINKRKRATFHHDRKAEEGTGYYYGQRQTAKDSLKKIIPIEFHTYESFAKDIVTSWFRGGDTRFSKGKAYTEAACYVFIDKKNVKKRYIPYARVLFVIGGRRMLLLPDEDVES